ncbi:MAG: hypothetical protein NC914_01365 [Candidatus Omnitrophica bacterium]|nr:hypothetical protein [Candidatus Omnitrophota bacterium]
MQSFFISTLALLRSLFFFFLYSFLFRFILGKFEPDARKIYNRRILISGIITISCFLFFVNISSLVEHYVRIWPIRYAGFALVFSLSLILGRIALKPDKKKAIVLGLSAVVLGCIIAVIILVSYSASSNLAISTQEQLQSLPYATWVSTKDTLRYSGVTRYDKDKACKGVNIYSPANLATAYLLDMQAKILHSWAPEIKEKKPFHHIQLAKNGDLLVIIEDKGIWRLDWETKVL